MLLKLQHRHFIHCCLSKQFVKNRKVHNHARVFSGIQPTGAPHLGNYFGAIQKWSELQNAGKHCVFSIVDLHSITLPQDPITLRQNIQMMAACLLACGIDPESSILFLQSQVPQHTELAWILGCFSSMARLTHLPQYKEKSKQLKENVPLGLYVYPVLQSADILLYKTTEVPVGEDQIQHIQTTQHLARVFNARFGEVFPVPVPLMNSDCARIKSLRKPDKKMSKSDPDIKSRIDLTDDPDTVTDKIKKALTDFTSAVTYDPENRPGVANLVLIHSLCTGLSPEKICQENTHRDTGQYKLVVAEVLVEFLKPIQEKIGGFLEDPTYVGQVLGGGSEKATVMAAKTVAEVKELMGLSANGLGTVDQRLLSKRIDAV